MPAHIENSETLGDPMPSEDLEGDDEWVLVKVGVDCRVEDVDGAIVRGGGEEGKCGVIADGSEGTGVISESQWLF